MASYIAAKSAVAGLTRALAREFRDGGVRVNAVAPGTMKTADNVAQMKDAKVRWVELDDLVAAVLYLASDAARDRKSTRLNSSHLVISYAVFCLKKKKKNID